MAGHLRSGGVGGWGAGWSAPVAAVQLHGGSPPVGWCGGVGCGVVSPSGCRPVAWRGHLRSGGVGGWGGGWPCGGGGGGWGGPSGPGVLVGGGGVRGGQPQWLPSSCMAGHL